MNDYKELLEVLRNIGKYGTINNALVSPTMLAAADAIEQLVKERDALLDANDSAHKDRREAESKAAKAELEVVCLKEKLADTVDTVKVVHKPTKAEFKRMAAQLGYEPVKHGHWTCDYVEKVELSYGVCGYIPHLKCSVCGMVSESYMRYDPPNMPEDMDGWRRCPYCGAKMEEEAE